MEKMPYRFLYSDHMCFSTYIFAGGVGSFFADLGLKILMTCVSLLIASRLVQRYKDWIDANPMRVTELKRIYLFLKAGFVKLFKLLKNEINRKFLSK